MPNDTTCPICSSLTYGQHAACPICDRVVCKSSRCTAWLGVEMVCTDCWRKWSRQQVHALRTQYVANTPELFSLGESS